MKNIRFHCLATLLFAGMSLFSFASCKQESAYNESALNSVSSTDSLSSGQNKTDASQQLGKAIEGIVTDTLGNPIEGVVISDSYNCTRTDAEGKYSMKRHKNASFVYYTIPAGYEVPTHSDTDHTACFYERLDSNRTEYNFCLTPLPGGKETHYNMIVIGDPQATNAYSPYYTDASDNPVKKSDVQRFTEETMEDIRRTVQHMPANTPVYAISMGDDVQYYGGYNADLEMQMRQALGSTSVKVFSVIGNHDQDGKALYKRKWEECWGPTDYSFDRGDVHFVCFNNVHFVRGSYYQPGELSDDQMAWLKQDLALTSKDKKVVLNYHIPLTFGNRPNSKASALDLATEQGHYSSSRLYELLEMLGDFKGGYELFCGHTHFSINHEIDLGAKHVLEHCHAAACGNIWQSNINICGTPSGYYVYDFEGTRLSNSYYKGTFWQPWQQMTLFCADTDFNGESYAADWDIPRNRKAVVANVFNADSRWKVVAVENGMEHSMMRICSKGQDAFAAGYHHKYCESVSYNFISKKNSFLIMNHLYYYVPEDTASEITVKAYDVYGNVYTANAKDSVTNAYNNYAHFYSAEMKKTGLDNPEPQKKDSKKGAAGKKSGAKNKKMKNKKKNK